MIFTVVQRLLVLNRASVSGNICQKIRILIDPLQNGNVLFAGKCFKTSTDIPCNLFHNHVSFCKQNLVKGIQEDISALHIKKRPMRKKKSILEEEEKFKTGVWNVKAMTTAEEYNLEALITGLLEQNLYIPQDLCAPFNSLPDVVLATAKYEIDEEPREIFFFREGSIVMWNISELEIGNILEFLKNYEQNRYNRELIDLESEIMTYSYSEFGKKSHIKDGSIVLAKSESRLDKYTFSNVMVQSVKLGVWEASLDRYVDSIHFLTEDLKFGRKLKMSRPEVLRKQGELFALRHLINLSSDLLDTPDFYWERDDLEMLYQKTCNYFSITKRTRVMNEKLNLCLEIIGIISSQLSDRHHIRLEWMIIVLIMVEVAFEVLHYLDRYFSS